MAVQKAAGLRNGPELAGAISGSDVRLPLCGHLHARDPLAGRTAYEIGVEELNAVIAELGSPRPPHDERAGAS
ncbi:hypothetical protein [Actinoplanes sp. NPDC048796]|uniref:hypothetical protein n=1 Tax=Actinoplanes sp. NPDC048796 TaxID=3155640 RepID=UPI0033DD2C6E